MRKSLIVLTMILALVLGLIATPSLNARNAYLRNRVVMLSSETGSCSGVEVRAPSGKIFTLTARHCSSLLTNGVVSATTEDDVKHTLRLVAIDTKSDLMLLTGTGDRAVDVAPGAYQKHQAVHTMTHGGGMPSYRTDGKLLKDVDVRILAFRVETPADIFKCFAIPGSVPERYEDITVCLTTVHLMMMTAKVIPGSSGGPTLDADENLIGIISCAAADGFSGIVPLASIHAFLRNR